MEELVKGVKNGIKEFNFAKNEYIALLVAQVDGNDTEEFRNHLRLLIISMVTHETQKVAKK